MAISYQAKIDLIVGGLEKIEAAEKRIKSLLRESRKLQRGGIAQRGTAALAATTRESRQQSRRQVRNAERRLELQSKLNAATDLYNRKLQQFQRAGGAGNKQLQGRVDQITQAFAVGTKEGTKNLRLTRALATELGRVVEQQRELNRARVQGNKGFEAGRRGFERIEVLRASGFGAERQISGAESLVRKIGSAAASGDQAAFNEAVRKAEVALRRLEREFQKAERAQRASTKAKRDVERAEKKLANETKRAATAQKKRRKQRFQDIATGAGFPLLFGGGPVQALAGGIGGALGGFGGSIAATALAGQVEAFARAAAETGVALTSTSGALELVREKSLFSKESNRELAAQLEEQGDAAGLAKLLTEELSLAIGNNGVNALQGLGDTTKETTRLWNLLTTQLFKLISGPLQGFLKIVNQVLGAVTGAASRESFFGDLGTQEAAARARFKELTGESLGTGRSGAQKRAAAEAQGIVFLSQEDALAQIRKEFQPQVKASIPVTAQDRRDITPGKAGRRSRLPDLKAEIALQERLLTLNNQIAQAKRNEDPVTESILQKEVAREKAAAKLKKIDAKRIPEAEKIAEKQLLELQTRQEILTIENRLKDIQAAKAEKFQQTLLGLQQEGELLQAKLDGNLQEVQLKQQIAEATEGLNAADSERVENLIRSNALLAEQVQTVQQIEQVAGQVIGAATSSIEALVSGTKTAEQAFADFLRSIASMLADAAKKIIAEYIAIGIARMFAGVPAGGGGGAVSAGAYGDMSIAGPSFFSGGMISGYANGGRPPVGKPSIVGERGPELFVPRTSGTIVPNEALGGSANVTVNVDASGSSVQGDGPSANQLGKAIGAAVQAELIKQKRPGGLLTR